nr:MCE family protein [Kibdelosporangium sp. MJ126-NF4]CEL22968.1 MCE-family protein Mce1D [Kibdelosporangium sp. MJ126-NF4]CTQ90107.1 MCE-family protein Mce1D [Kibdelosporangium sp. MJ126-NF4]
MRGKYLKLGALVAVVAILAVTVASVTGRDDKRVYAYFTAAVGVYPGSDVRVLGVAIGRIDAVEPMGEQVRVTMSLDRAAAVPADANALVVTPSLVSDRYVQLTPVYRSGAKMADGAVIPAPRTVVPVELDELFSSLDRLTTALGPQGANADGALSDFLEAGAKNLGGNGQQLNQTIRELGKASRTLSGSQDDLFATVDTVQKFTTMLASNDTQVRTFNNQLAQVSGILADERDAFGDALRELAGVLDQVRAFVEDNRGRVKSNVDKLTGVTKVLADQKASLSEALDTAPLALGNLLKAYDPATRTIDGRADILEFSGAPLPMPLAGGQ